MGGSGYAYDLNDGYGFKGIYLSSNSLRCLHFVCAYFLLLPSGSEGKESVCNAGDSADTGPIPGSGRSPGEGNGNPLQCSCLENSMDKEAWQARVPGVTKSQTQLSMHAHIYRCQSYLNKMVLKRERERRNPAVYYPLSDTWFSFMAP